MKKSRHCLASAIFGLVFIGSFFAVKPDFGLGADVASSHPSTYMEPFGVPLAPGIYLANFMLLYFVNPEIAANMPAYMAAIPQDVNDCLLSNPEGCPYTDMKPYFDEQALEVGGCRNKRTFWPSSCRIDPKWQVLAAPEYRLPDQINQSLGRMKADQLAKRLNMDQGMILTNDQCNCMLGIDPPSNDDGRDIIRACLQDLTNSVGKAFIPLSSYGLSLDKQGNVRSNCAEGAPCLQFNTLATNGALWAIADECSFTDKLLLLIGPNTKTPFPKLLLEGVACQQNWGPDSNRPCIVETINPGHGGQWKKK